MTLKEKNTAKTAADYVHPKYPIEILEKLCNILVDNTIRLAEQIEILVGESKTTLLTVTKIEIENKDALKINEDVKIKCAVKNKGLIKGSESFTLNINGEDTESKHEYTLDADAEETKEFTYKPTEAKVYAVSIGTANAEFEIKEQETQQDLNVTINEPVLDTATGKYTITCKLENTTDTKIDQEIKGKVNETDLPSENVSIDPKGETEITYSDVELITGENTIVILEETLKFTVK